MAATVVLIVDRSGSMSLAEKLPAAQTDASTFVNIMQANDRFAVTCFDESFSSVYPSSSALATITGQPIQDAASAAIARLSAGGLTNIEEAIGRSHQIATQAQAPRGMVLLSDGMWNKGEDPLASLPTDVPIFTIALGGQFNPAFMQTVAQRTGGTYHFTPDAWGLAAIYNDIVSETQVARTSVNVESSVPQYRFSLVPVSIPANVDEATVAVDWLPRSVSFVPGTPVGSQLTVRLIEPTQQPSTLVPAAVGSGFAVFRLQAPAAGTWQVEVWSAAPVTVDGTVGAFEPNSSVSLTLDPPAAPVTVGEPVESRARLADSEEPLAEVHASASLEVPVRSLEDSLRLHAERLAAVEPSEEALADGVPEPLARLARLRESSSRDQDPHPRLRRPLPPPQLIDGELRATLDGLPHPGEATLRLAASGRTSDGRVFTRQRRASFVVA
jgi:hypothetical protein